MLAPPPWAAPTAVDIVIVATNTDVANTRMRLRRSVGPPNAYKNLRAHRRLGVADVIARAKCRFGVVDVIACARDVGGK